MFSLPARWATANCFNGFLMVVMLTIPAVIRADHEIDKTIFLVTEKHRIVAVNAETGQFFDLVISAKERIQQRYIAKGVAILVTNQRFAGVGVFPSGWRSTRRQAGEKVITVEVADYSALVVTSRRILTFNGKAGAWSATRR